MKKLFRRLVAFLRRTFVTDCPHCHHHFYGFHNYIEHIKIGRVHYRIVCHRCAQKQLELKKH